MSIYDFSLLPQNHMQDLKTKPEVFRSLHLDNFFLEQSVNSRYRNVKGIGWTTEQKILGV